MYDLRHLKTRKEVAQHFQDYNNFDNIIAYIQSEEGLIENPSNLEFFDLTDSFTAAWIDVLMCGDKVFSFQIGIDVTHDSRGTTIRSIDTWFNTYDENYILKLDDLSEYKHQLLIDFLNSHYIEYEIK